MMADMTPEQRQAFEAALTRSKEKQQKREEVPTQRLRTALGQGLGLGFGDELEARAISLFTGRPYDEALAEVRGNIKAYQEARPGEAFGYELGGAALPAIASIAAAPFTGGSSTAAVAPTLGRLAGVGAAQGAGYAFGTGEGGLGKRLSRVPGGAFGGAVGGAVGGAATRALGSAATTLSDAARRTIGRRGSSVVENEIQRLVQQTGRSADDIAQDIIDGKLLAENKTIRMAVRAMRAKGGEASRIIQEGIEARPAQTRHAAMEQVKGALGSGGSGSQAAKRAASEEATRRAERLAYGQFTGREAPSEVVDALKDTLRRAPSASKEVEIRIQAQTGAKPFYKITKEGDVVFTRAPTIDEAESVRRAVANRATSLYRNEGMGGAGEAVSQVEKNLRDVLDLQVPELARTRAQAALVRANRDAYEDGVKSLSGDINERMLQFSKYAQGENADEALSAYRAGVLQALEARATTGSRQSMIRNMLNPETKEGILFQQVFPENMQDDVLKRLDIANEANEAAQKILGGSPTSDTIMEAARQGMGISVSDVADVLSGSPTAMLRVAANLAGKVGRDLSDAERARIAQILVSNDADLVRRAITDESAMAKLVDKLAKMTATATRAAGASSAVGGSMVGADVSGRVGSGLLAQ